MPKPRTAQIEIRGAITEETEQALAARLGALAEAGAPPVEVGINSGGGSVLAGLGAYSALTRYPGPVSTWTDGIAASMAGVIFLAGQRRRIAHGAWIMLHGAWVESTGPAEVLRRDAAQLDRLNQTLAHILTGRTAQPPEVVAEWLVGESWFDADLSLRYGLATEIEGNAAAAALTAVPLATFRHPPAALARIEKDYSMTTADAAAASTAAGGTHDRATEPQNGASAALLADRNRCSEIARLCSSPMAAKAGLPPTYAATAIHEGYSPDRVRNEIFDALANQPDNRFEISNHVRAEGGADWASPQALASRMQGALAHRLSNGRVPLAPESAEFRGMALHEMARELLAAQGHRGVNRMAKGDVIERALGAAITHTTSDFPSLMQGAGERTLLDSFEVSRAPIIAVTRRTSVSDFRPVTRLRRGEAPALSAVGEAGEIPYGSLGEESESFRIKTFGKRFSITREALINDDLGAFSDFLGEMGRATAQTENVELMALLAQNSGSGPTLSDGQTLFHANHGNVLTTGSSLDAGSLGDARTLLRRTVGGPGNYLNLSPRFLVVPPELESTALSLMASEFVGTSNEANPVRNMAQIIVEPRLTGTAWYLFADSALGPVLEMAYLDGSRPGATDGGPALATFEEPGVLGVIYRVVFDFAAVAVGWRGAVRATGAA